MSNTAKGALLALTAFAIFATHDVVVKFLGARYHPFQIIFFSVLLSFPLVMLLLIRDRTDGNLRPRHPWWTALRTGAAVTTGSCAFYAFSVLPMAQTYAIMFTTPLLITLLSIPVLGEKVGWRRGVAVAVGLCGVLVVLRPGSTPISLGHLTALAAAVFSSLASVVVRKIGSEERAAVLMLYPMLANFVLMGGLLTTVYRPMPVEHLGMVGIIALFGFIAGLFLIAAYRSAEAVVVAPMQYSQMIWAAIYGALIFDESVDSWTMVGAGIIIVSGLYIVMREGLGKASTNRPVLRTQSRPETGIWPRVSTLMGLTGRRD